MKDLDNFHLAVVGSGSSSTQLTGYATLYLVIAALSLLVALQLIKTALAPIGPLLQAIAAATLVVLAVIAAFLLLAAAMLDGAYL